MAGFFDFFCSTAALEAAAAVAGLFGGGDFAGDLTIAFSSDLPKAPKVAAFTSAIHTITATREKQDGEIHMLAAQTCCLASTGTGTGFTFRFADG
jgi:hypothetical protein